MKNKKLLKFLVLPLLCLSLILPLCSFITIEDGVYVEPYLPYVNNSIEYVYHRKTSTLDSEYYGYIPNMNSFAFDNTSEAEGVDSLSNIASDFVIVGNTTLNYARIKPTSSVPYNSQFDERESYIWSSPILYSEDPSVAYFTGVIEYNGYISLEHSSDTTSPYRTNTIFLATDSKIYTASDIDYFVYVEEYRLVDGEYVSDSWSSSFSGGSLTEDDISRINAEDSAFLRQRGLSLGGIIDVAKSHSDHTSYIDNYITRIKLELTRRDLTIDDTGYKYICLSDNVYSSEKVAEYNQIIFNNLYNKGETKGFNAGYSSGVDNAVTEWGGVSEFLKNVIGAFTQAEIFPGFVIGDILGIVAGALLLLFFLKMFAGG